MLAQRLESAAPLDAKTLTVGIEEEFFLVDGDTLGCVAAMPEPFEQEMRARLGPQFEREIHASMIELISRPHASVRDLRNEMNDLRGTAASVAARHGLRLLASGTHPFSDWREAQRSPGPRYDTVGGELQILSARGLTCGMHVHVQLPEGRRIDVMNRMQQVLPLLLCLSASSPFWLGANTGLQSYRTAACAEGPRSGLPGPIRSEEEYDALIAALTKARLIPDASFVWWPIRPSMSHPTLEMRVADCCTDTSDAIAIAALYRTLVTAMLLDESLRACTAPWRYVLNTENMWQAARYGLKARFIDPHTLEVLTAGEAIEEVLRRTMWAAEWLGQEQELENVSAIFERGTSADRQVAAYEAMRDAGETEALREVASSVLVSA